MTGLVRVFMVLSVAALVQGCASGYKEFYRPTPGATPEAIAAMRAGPPPATPAVERSAPIEPDRVLDAYARKGYVAIGSATFNSGRPESEQAAIQQGQAVGADLVLILNPKHTGSVTTSIPMTTPTTSTTYSTGRATATGPAGTVSAYGTGTSTTYGSQTTYVPITIHRADYGAIFFVKQRFSLGAFTRDLSDSERQQLQTNKGAVVRLIADGTPAFDADLLVGDVVVQIDGVPVPNANGLSDQLNERRGKVVTLSLLRGGKRIEKSVQLNP